MNTERYKARMVSLAQVHIQSARFHLQHARNARSAAFKAESLTKAAQLRFSALGCLTFARNAK